MAFENRGHALTVPITHKYFGRDGTRIGKRRIGNGGPLEAVKIFDRVLTSLQLNPFNSNSQPIIQFVKKIFSPV